ncbi:MAG: hypothetical protein ACKVZH_13015, partial [Blastocatellia bacterium]
MAPAQSFNRTHNSIKTQSTQNNLFSDGRSGLGAALAANGSSTRGLSKGLVRAKTNCLHLKQTHSNSKPTGESSEVSDSVQPNDIEAPSYSPQEKEMFFHEDTRREHEENKTGLTRFGSGLTGLTADPVN